MHEIFGLKHVFSTFQETVWSHLKCFCQMFFLALKQTLQYYYHQHYQLPPEVVLHPHLHEEILLYHQQIVILIFIPSQKSDTSHRRGHRVVLLKWAFLGHAGRDMALPGPNINLLFSLEYKSNSIIFRNASKAKGLSHLR